MNIGEKIRQMPPKRRRILAFVSAVLLIIVLFLGFRWLTEWRFMIGTNDAYVQGDIAAIAPKLSAYIKEVPVLANQPVRKGDILFVLDDGDYKIAQGQAQAGLDTQKSTLKRIEAEIVAATSSLDEAKANYASAKAEQVNNELTFNRAKALEKNQYVPTSTLDSARAALEKSNADVSKAQAQINTTIAEIAVLKALYEETKTKTATLKLDEDKAARDLSFTVIRAPFDGIVGNLQGKKGDFVTNGQRLAALVPTHALYIDANYKETQLDDIYGGETAHISVDGYDGGKFEGKVLSLAPATGAIFSVLPPQNATGNFTKVVQRVPVRISIPEKILATGRIRAGMSVEVDIDRRTRQKHAMPIRQIPAAPEASPDAAQADAAPAQRANRSAGAQSDSFGQAE